MDIRKQLLKEQSKKNCNLIIGFIGSNNVRFEELVQVYLEGPYRVTQRAAWPLSYCVQRHPLLVVPHLKSLLDFVSRSNSPVAVKRNTMRLLQFIEIPGKWQGKVANICFGFMANHKETIAVQVFAMTVLFNLAKAHPEIGRELEVLIEDRLPYSSAGFRSRGIKILKQLRSNDFPKWRGFITRIANFQLD